MESIETHRREGTVGEPGLEKDRGRLCVVGRFLRMTLHDPHPCIISLVGSVMMIRDHPHDSVT